TALADLVLPQDCAGCDLPGTVLCARCEADFAGAARRVCPSPPPPGFPRCWAVADYDGPVRAALLAYKEHDRRTLAPVLGRALGRAVVGVVPASSGAPDPVVLVPVPSTPAAVRARGADHVLTLARVVAGELVRTGRDVRVGRLLGVARTRRDSAGLDAAARRENLAGAFRARLPDVARSAAARIVLVDDLVTTGATLAEATAALGAVGVRPAGAAVVAATGRRHPPTSAGRAPDGGRYSPVTACRACRHAQLPTGGDEAPSSS
ncbi:MAG TPA: phosphoribosyltransferase family protein, partial [Mycobacteriales bacterium]